MTNVVETLALAISPGTSLEFVISTMSRDPGLAPYSTYIWYLLGFHGVGGIWRRDMLSDLYV